MSNGPVGDDEIPVNPEQEHDEKDMDDINDVEDE